MLATELKNNACKLARWTSQSLLSGCEMIKLGFISRAAPRDRNNHVILGTQNAKPKDFAAQINLSIDNCWGIVRAMVDLVMMQEDGKYLLVKVRACGCVLVASESDGWCGHKGPIRSGEVPGGAIVAPPLLSN